MKKVWGNNQVNLRDDFHFYTSTLSVHLSLKANTTTANRCSLIYMHILHERENNKDAKNRRTSSAKALF